jgi:hypothetical protein
MVESSRLASSLVLIALAVGCSPSNQPRSDSNSNWLTECEVSADCRGDGACICGLCTRTCERDMDCAIAGDGAFCVAPEEASSGAACAAIVSAAEERLCLAGCREDADCGPESGCVAGACWRSPQGVVDRRDAARVPDAGADAGRATGPLPPPVLRGIDAGTDLSAVDAAVRFDEPVVRPVPEEFFQGDSVEAAVAGVWEAVPDVNGFWGGDMRLEITAGPSGVTGTIAFMCSPGRCQPEGPPPPATDPEAGYPPGLDPIQQDLLRTNILARTPYRMLDARFADGRLTFWFTNNDLWRGWCALQTSYPVDANGRPEYACTEAPQPCFDFYALEPEDISAHELLCCAGGSPCLCTASGCDLNYQSAVRELDLRVDGDAMEGVMLMGRDTFRAVLRRTAP